jgi:hypothetical protein
MSSVSKILRFLIRKLMILTYLYICIIYAYMYQDKSIYNNKNGFIYLSSFRLFLLESISVVTELSSVY